MLYPSFIATVPTCTEYLSSKYSTSIHLLAKFRGKTGIQPLGESYDVDRRGRRRSILVKGMKLTLPQPHSERGHIDFPSTR